MPLIWVVGMIIMVAINAYLAYRKGRNPWLWAFIGLWIGLFGILLLLILPNRRTAAIAPVPSLPLPTIEPVSEALSSTELYRRAKWYYLDTTHTQHGPLAFETLLDLWESKTITAQTYVWQAEMRDWKTISTVPDLEKAISTSLK